MAFLFVIPLIGLKLRLDSKSLDSSSIWFVLFVRTLRRSSFLKLYIGDALSLRALLSILLGDEVGLNRRLLISNINYSRECILTFLLVLYLCERVQYLLRIKWLSLCLWIAFDIGTPCGGRNLLWDQYCSRFIILLQLRGIVNLPYTPWAKYEEVFCMY
jgi:hypothetical protein